MNLPTHAMRYAALCAVSVATLAGCGKSLHGSVDPDLGNQSAATSETVELTATDGASQECLDALDRADDLIDFMGVGLDKASDGFQAAQDAFQAASDLDLDGMRQAGEDIRAVGQWYADHKDEARSARSAYDDAAAECRATG